MKVHVVIDLTDGNEGSPGVNVYTVLRDAQRRERALERENKQLGLSAESIVILIENVEVE